MHRWQPLMALALLGIVGLVFLADWVSETRASDRVRTAVRTAEEVRLNGELLRDPARVLAALGSVHHVPAHHSGPTAPIQVDLSQGASTVQVVIARDSERPTEFWVYWPGPNWHRNELGQDAGRITSADLDEFLRAKGL